MLESNQIYCGDCLDVMRDRMDDNSVDTVITDPPYGLKFMGKKWDYEIPTVEIFTEILRVAKPGAIMLCFGGTRTWHRIAVNIEDAGWEIRDTIMWVYGSGFPKSLDIGKAIDKSLGNKREVVGMTRGKGGENLNVISRENAGDSIDAKGCGAFGHGAKQIDIDIPITVPASEESQAWNSYGTALKPAYEPIIVAMKPLDGTYAENALKWGVAGLNIDSGRVGLEILPECVAGQSKLGTFERKDMITPERIGRFPANFIHDGSEEVLELFPNTTSGSRSGTSSASEDRIFKLHGGECIGNSGSAARFFYCAKSSRSEREYGLQDTKHVLAGEMTGGRQEGSAGLNSPRAGAGRISGAHNFHPTVKPVALMEYLCKLTHTPTGGIVLDPFAGSGTTGIACVRTNRNYILIEMNEDYCEIASKRIAAECPQLSLL